MLSGIHSSYTRRGLSLEYGPCNGNQAERTYHNRVGLVHLIYLPLDFTMWLFCKYFHIFIDTLNLENT